MSWINSNATYKQNSKNDLSFYHGFSKTPVEPTSTGTAATTLGNASTKGGHTVIGTEVWAEEIPWFGLVPSRAVAVTRLSGLTKLNDLVKVDGEGGKVYKYIGADDATFTEAQWSSFWQEVTLTNGMTLNNRHNQPVLRYYLNQPMQTLTTTNNASIDSKGYATRLFVDESNHTGQTSGGAVVSQFAAGTDNIKNGIPSVELNPKLYLGTTEKIAGTHYYDYNVSGTVLWSSAVTSSSPKISCFRYIGKTVTGQLSDAENTIKSHSIDIADIKLALGLDTNPDSTTQSVTSRVETVEDVIKVLLGLSDSDTITATESIADVISAAEGRVKVTTDALAGRIAALEGVKLSVQVVDALPETPVINTLYLVPEEGSTTGTYVEYIAYKPEGSETVTTERIGTTAVDLSGYTTDTEHTALAERVTALDVATTGRVAVVEGKVSTLEGKVSTLETSTIPDIQKDITDGIAEAKEYAEEKAEEARNAAIASAKVTITASTDDDKSGIIISPNGSPANEFTLGIDQSVIATVASVTAISEVILSNKSELDGKIANINDAIDALTTGDNSVSTQITNAITSAIADGGAIDNRIDAVITNATATVDATGSITKAIKDSLADITTSGALGTAIADAKKAGTDAASALDTAKAQSLEQTGTLSGMFTVKTAGTVGTGITGITITDAGLAQAISDAKKAGTDAATAVGTLSSTDVTSQSVAGAGITVTLAGKVGAPTLTGSVATSSYTAATETAAGSWTNESNVVTGATVKAALADVATAHTKDIETIQQTLEGITTTGLTREVVADGKTKEEIENPQANVIYLVKDSTSESGAYVEYLYVNGTWEAIGTTSTDLAEYAKSADVTSKIEALDATETVNGLTVTQVDGKITGLTEALITASVPTGTTSVEGNIAYVGSEKHVIAPEKFQTAAQMPSTLTTWVADLSNLTVGDSMFSGCTGLTTFIGDLSNLTSGVDMFAGCSLTVESVEFIADTLPTVTSGTITLGTTTEAHADAIADIQAKGWTIA